MFFYASAEYYLQPNADDVAHEQTIICRQLFAGLICGGLLANEKEEQFASHDDVE